MIRQQIDSITLNSYAGANSELIVPSKVTTSCAKDDTFDLSYTNFMISTEMDKSYTDGIYVGGIYPVNMTVDSYNYTAYMNVVSCCNVRNGVKLNLQYNSGLSSSYEPGPEPPEPPAYTFAFENNRYTCTATYTTGGSTEYSDAVVLFNVNGSYVSLSPSEVSISGVGSSLAQYMALNDPDNGTYGFRCTASSTISTSVTVTATYNGDTATAALSIRYNEITPVPDLSQQISNILGTSYNVVNDMSEEDALAAANNILYGDEQPPV